MAVVENSTTGTSMPQRTFSVWDYTRLQKEPPAFRHGEWSGTDLPGKGWRGTKGKELLESLFTEFTTSVSMRETNIQVDPVAADKDARLQVLAANSKAALAKADEAMNVHYAGIERFVDEFNETAISLGDKARLHHAKSLHNNQAANKKR